MGIFGIRAVSALVSRQSAVSKGPESFNLSEDGFLTWPPATTLAEPVSISQSQCQLRTNLSGGTDYQYVFHLSSSLLFF